MFKSTIHKSTPVVLTLLLISLIGLAGCVEATPTVDTTAGTAAGSTAGSTLFPPMPAGSTTPSAGTSAGTSTVNPVSGELAGDSAGAEAGVLPPTCVDEICDALDNDCDGRLDEGVICPCSSEETACYGGPVATRGVGLCSDGARSCDPTGELWSACEGWVGPEEEFCDELDNDCDGIIDEGVRSACGVCGEETPVEICDELDNDCDGQIDEGQLNACGECGPTPEELCDQLDNDCDGEVDEDVCLVLDLNLDGDCLTVTCPPEAPYPVACQVDFQGDDPRGCVAYNPPSSDVYLQEGNQCDAGRVVGSLTCSLVPGGRLNETNCPINKIDTSYPRRREGCAETN